MNRSRRTTALLFALALLAPVASRADDKDILKKTAAKPNLLIIFANSATTMQSLAGGPLDKGYPASFQWDGEADSFFSKLGASKRVLRQFVAIHQDDMNIGMTRYSNSGGGDAELYGKHWLYTPMEVDFPNDADFREPVGVVERWGRLGEGPCDNFRSQYSFCSLQAPGQSVAPVVWAIDKTKYPSASITGTYFGTNPFARGVGARTVAVVNLDNKTRIRAELVDTAAKDAAYGDAYASDFSSLLRTDGSGNPYALLVRKTYETLSAGSWSAPATTPGGSPNPVVVRYQPYLPAGVSASDMSAMTYLFYPPGTPQAGQAIGFLRNGGQRANSAADTDYYYKAECSGMALQIGKGGTPLIDIPRDYNYPGPNQIATCTAISLSPYCCAPQVSTGCFGRWLRPQAYVFPNGGVTAYDPGMGSMPVPACDQTTWTFNGAGGSGSVAVSNNALVIDNQSTGMAPGINLFKNTYDYLTTGTAFNDYKNGFRTDDPYTSCRTTAVLLIADIFQGCGQEPCTSGTGATVMQQFKDAKIPIYVIGLGGGIDANNSSEAKCIATKSGAIVPGTNAPGYFPVTSPEELFTALQSIASILTESTKDFASASISSVQAGSEQMAYLATFNAAAQRTIWDGRINGYRLDKTGALPSRVRTVKDPADPFFGVKIDSPSNSPDVLIWNAGQNLIATPGTGATNPLAILQPGASPSTGFYLDTSTDTQEKINTRYYAGRKIVFALPEGYATDATTGFPTTFPIPSGTQVPENRFNLVTTTQTLPTAEEAWWKALRALLGTPAAIPTPAPVSTAVAKNALRFIWGDRDNVTKETTITKLYCPDTGDNTDPVSDGTVDCPAVGTNTQGIGLKLGDVFHSNPAIVGPPRKYAYWAEDDTGSANGYRAFAEKFRYRRRILYTGANDGLFHAFDIGAWNRDKSVCTTLADGTTPGCYDLGSGLELFAYAPRAIMPVYPGLTSPAGPQTKRNEWTVDGAPAYGDVFIDPSHTGAGTGADPLDKDKREWRTVVIAGVREGSPFEGTSGEAPRPSIGSYFALDVTQPDEIVTADSKTVIADGTVTGFKSPKCLDKSGDSTCSADWPAVLWEFSDVGNRDGNGFVDMGETWAEPGISRVRVCKSGCGTASAQYDVVYVAIFGGGFDRERKDRRGNWLYMVDIETGNVLYRAYQGCEKSVAGSGCTDVPFGSIPSGAASIDYNSDGYLDVVYVGDLLGRMWRVDTTDLRYVSGYGTLGRLDNKIDVSGGASSGSGRPFLFFKSPQPAALGTKVFFPIYYRPVIVATAGGGTSVPSVGVAWATGDRDDILATVDAASLAYSQRVYYVVDSRADVTRYESNLTEIATATSASLTTVPATGWYMKMANGTGERLITDVLAFQGYLYFSTFSPYVAGSALSGNGCPNPPKCSTGKGFSRFYTMAAANGNPAPGNTDRGTVVPKTDFVTSPVFYVSGNQQGNIGFMTASGGFETPPVERRTSTSLREWKER